MYDVRCFWKASWKRGIIWNPCFDFVEPLELYDTSVLIVSPGTHSPPSVHMVPWTTFKLENVRSCTTGVIRRRYLIWIINSWCGRSRSRNFCRWQSSGEIGLYLTRQAKLLLIWRWIGLLKFTYPVISDAGTSFGKSMAFKRNHLAYDHMRKPTSADEQCKK